MRYIGVDGGGTKTAFIIIDEHGNILGNAVKKSCHYKQAGFEGFKTVIKDGIKEVCKTSNTDLKNIDYTFLGLPGYGENQEDAMEMEKIIGQILKKDNFKCGNDVEAGWAGSLGCRPGINIVAGTGSIAIGVDENGNTSRSGGWGHFCGDEGSAYWLGKRAVELFAKESDLRLVKTPIYDILKNNLRLSNDFDLITLLLDEWKLNRGEIAKLALYLFQAAEQGDEYAIDIYKEAAHELFLHIRSIIKQLHFSNEGEILISYSGGVFKAGGYILEPLEKEVFQNYNNAKIVVPLLAPVTGSALYALKMHGTAIDNKLINNLKEKERILNI